MLNLPSDIELLLSIKRVSGKLFYVDEEVVIFTTPSAFLVYDAVNLDDPKFELSKNNNMNVCACIRVKNRIFYQDNEGLTADGDFNYVDLDKREIGDQGESQYSALIFLKTEGPKGYFKADSKNLIKLSLNDFSVECSSDRYRRTGMPAVFDSGICMKSADTINFFNNDLELIDSIFSGDLVGSTDNFILREIASSKNVLILWLENGSIIGLDFDTKDILWSVEGFYSKKWAVSEEGVVYTVWKDELVRIDSATGDTTRNKIKSEFLKTENLQLFQLSASSKHLWCGFIGNGLCAINLSSFEVDFHEFSGCTVNRKPFISNNRLYIQLISNGIGLDGSDLQEVVLEGQSGFISDGQKKAFYP
ncbi:hypothetical protein [Gilvimarinus algae]|uniref:Uncharacterized protein n=1 Tax=Gilvimarinus algae TaxID=3058037 RepID=A0ABT8TDB2_9GAMM|nr:hypothetical protein [Gilvimarinus sp. SDUM040014]MDO3381610.1 hypothetical protein [Gilvimarinus sp. SDUM040014]